MARQNYRDLTKEQLVSLLEARDRKKFGLIWERDEIEHDRALNSDFVALDEVPELGAGEGTKENLIIEGDNFDALRALKVAYAGKVKCIYIDPPYNTGNRDFVYNDRFVEKDHSWRHSLWLEFMHQRLTLARDLLAQDGAIFVSIDDNEIFHLGLLMNEVFGEGNFVANIVWEKSYTANQTAKFISDNHDYVLVFALNTSNLEFGKLERSVDQIEKFKNPDNDLRGAWKAENLSAGKFYSAGQFAIIGPTGTRFNPPAGRYWRCNEDQYKAWLDDGRITFGLKGEGRPMLKKFLKEMTTGLTPRTWWPHAEGGSNKEASLELKEIIPSDNPFSTPKPVRLIERILQIATNPGDLVLDFFAGSGTTAHAVLKMNSAHQDAEPRRFILVSSTEATTEQPEKNLCRDVCRRRVANVIAGYGNTPGTGGSFAYLKTRRIPMTRVVRKIEHGQVWLFLQLMHFGGLTPDAPLASGRLMARSTPEESVFYPTTLTEAIVQRMEKEMAHAANVTIYTWQPEALAARLEKPGVSILPIPQTLIDRFGRRP